MFSDLVASMSNHVRLLRVAVYATAQAKGKMLHPHIGIIIAWKEKNNRREKNMIEGVLFDLGNTVVLFPALGVETEELSAERKSMLKSLVKIMYRSLKEQGLEADWYSFFKAYQTVRSEQLKWQRQTLKEYDMNIRLAKVLKVIGLNIPPTSVIIQQALNDYFRSYVEHVEISEGTFPTLRSLRSKYRLGVVTNFAYPASIYAILEKFSLEKFFYTVTISGEIGWVKPSPLIFQAALAKLELQANQVVFVGDDPETDIKGAKSIGMKAILLTRGPTCSQADATISDLSKVATVIQEFDRALS